MAFAVHTWHAARRDRPRRDHLRPRRRRRRPRRSLAGPRLQLLPLAGRRATAGRSNCSTPTPPCSATAGRRAAAFPSCFRSPTASAMGDFPGTARNIGCRSTTRTARKRHPRLRLPPAVARRRPGGGRLLRLGDGRVPDGPRRRRTVCRSGRRTTSSASRTASAPACCASRRRSSIPDGGRCHSASAITPISECRSPPEPTPPIASSGRRP